MSFDFRKKCSEDGCENYAEHQVKVVLRSRPNIRKEVSDILGYACDEHKGVNIEGFVPPDVWDRLIERYKAQGRQLPVKAVSYIVIEKYVPIIPDDYTQVLKIVRK